jgi:anti-sigma-K factor RskA
MQERHVDDLIDAYTLDALEPDEMDAVARHLEGCERCRALADAARATSDALLLAAPLATPPVGLRARVLARIAEESTAAGQPEQPQQPAHPAAARPTADNPLQRFVRSLLGGQDRAGQHAEQLLHELLADPHSRTWQVGGTEHAPGATGRLIASAERQEAVLVVSGLDRAPQGHEYQVWFLRGGQPLPNSLFRVDRHGRALPVVRVAEPLADFETIAVTPEPVGGSPGPTGPIVLAGDLTATA